MASRCQMFKPWFDDGNTQGKIIPFWIRFEPSSFPCQDFKWDQVGGFRWPKNTWEICAAIGRFGSGITWPPSSSQLESEMPCRVWGHHLSPLPNKSGHVKGLWIPIIPALYPIEGCCCSFEYSRPPKKKTTVLTRHINHSFSWSLTLLFHVLSFHELQWIATSKGSFLSPRYTWFDVAFQRLHEDLWWAPKRRLGRILGEEQGNLWAKSPKKNEKQQDM